MKKLLLVLLLAVPVFTFAQNKITLKDGNEFFAIIDGLYRETLVFVGDVVTIGDDRVDIGNVVSIAGETPNYRKRAILKRNPSVLFVPGTYTKQDVSRFNLAGEYVAPVPSIEQADIELTAGDHIYKAGNMYLTGFGLAVGGSAAISIGFSIDEKSLAAIGGVAVLSGIVATLVGHVELRKAGQKMNSDAITLAGSKTGVGLAINF